MYKIIFGGNYENKKILSLVLALVLTMSLFSGCVGVNNEKDNSLTLLYSLSVPEKFIEGLKAKFPEINFELEFYQGANYTEYANETLSHGEGSDIFSYSLILSEDMAQKYLVDLSGETFLGNFDSAILDTISKGGKVYQLTGPVSSRCVVYNKTLFAQYGWKEPTTFNELLTLVKQIRKDAPEITPIAFPIPSAAYPFTMVTSLAQCGFLSSPEGAVWEEKYFKGEASVSEGFDEGFTMMEKLIDANAFDGEKYKGLWHTISGDPCERKAAMSFSLGGTSPVLPLLEKTATKEDYGEYCTDEFGLLPFFGLQDGQEGLNVTLSTTWGINKNLEKEGNEKKLENALKVMEYLSTAEAQSLLQTDNGQIPTIKALENTEVHPEVQKLWNLNENGKKAIFLYSGYEDIILDAGQIVQDAVLADDSTGMREKFIKKCDEIREKTLKSEVAAETYGHIEENLSQEDTVRLYMSAIQKKNPVDFTLATYRGISNGIINKKGVGAKLFTGDVTDRILSTILQEYNATIVTVELTGAEVKELLTKGKTITDIENDTTATFKYTAYGLNTVEENGEITSIELSDGKELDEKKTYTVNLSKSDYTDEFAENHTITDTGIIIEDAIKDYLKANTPITADKIK